MPVSSVSCSISHCELSALSNRLVGMISYGGFDLVWFGLVGHDEGWRDGPF